jgi:transcriptional regulator with XRE-family HTH domain
MNSLLNQLKQRRIDLGLKQHDMLLRVGVSRQQYQRIESKGNPRLDTLELLATGLGVGLIAVPLEKLAAVQSLLNGELQDSQKSDVAIEDPWQGVFDEE